ncbi:hypothetical protein P7C71_g4673, partial [Lecanoromycetidae sp. Uapishka_2]
MDALINFDIIESHKENIQSLPGGRSAKALASTFAPTSKRPSGPTPGDTRNLNDAIREEYELELIAIGDSDDPLDIYDRYVRWTFSAYPSAQATTESQLRPLLERATKAFQSATHYKNDPRYLKLWLNYIRFFSDAPRETFAYLARHNIGEGLALFYEEFAAWLEGAGRWNQADEVYKLGIEREARPAERLVRKFGEFQHRYESRAQNGDEPSSPALPTVRPALVTKMDPFAVSTPQSADPQAPRPSNGIVDIGREAKAGRSKKMKTKEVKGDTQTRPKLRRKNSAEPTMTLHTKAATDDILNIFNQPLRNVDPMAGPADSAGESDYEDDDYTSAGESTGTGRISGATSEFGDTEADLKSNPELVNISAAARSVSPWSDFTTSKHVPKLDADLIDNENATNGTEDQGFVVLEDAAPVDVEQDEDIALVTPVSPECENELNRPRYVPIPPEDYEPPTRPYRDASQISQNRLPFMTPIVEKTESSMGALTIREEKDYFNSKTPSRHDKNGHITPQIDEELLSSPFQEIVNEASPPRVPKLKIAKSNLNSVPKKALEGPIVKDAQCNPVDDSIRQIILENVQPPLSSYPGYHDYRPLNCNKAPEIRKFIKALTKKNSSDKTTTSLSMPPTLRFPQASSKIYTIKRELGKGAFAPVYLATEEDPTGEEDQMIAIKCEHPPTPWEFHIM